MFLNPRASALIRGSPVWFQFGFFGNFGISGNSFPPLPPFLGVSKVLKSVSEAELLTGHSPRESSKGLTQPVWNLADIPLALLPI